MEVYKRPSSSTGFHSEHFAQPVYRRADSFADLDTLYHRHRAVVAPKPVKARRSLSSAGPAATGSNNSSPVPGIHGPAMQRMLSIDDDHYSAYEELHEILFSSSESDLDSLSDGVMNFGSTPSPPVFSISTPIEIARSSSNRVSQDAALLATPPSRAPNPCSQNHIFRADSDEDLVLRTSPPAVSISNERRYQHAY